MPCNKQIWCKERLLSEWKLAGIHFLSSSKVYRSSFVGLFENEQWIPSVVKGRQVWRVVRSGQPVGSRDDQLTNAQRSLPCCLFTPMWHTPTWNYLGVGKFGVEMIRQGCLRIGSCTKKNPFTQIADLEQSWVGCVNKPECVTSPAVVCLQHL